MVAAIIRYCCVVGDVQFLSAASKVLIGGILEHFFSIPFGDCVIHLKEFKQIVMAGNS